MKRRPVLENVKDLPARRELVGLDSIRRGIYQRDPRGDAAGLAVLHTIVSEFNRDLVGTILCNVRRGGPDAGELFVIDGGTRVAGLQDLGFKAYEVQILTHSLTEKEEAILFDALNRNRRPLKPFQKWKAILVGEDTTALGIQRMCSEIGLTVSGGGGGRGKLTCIKLLLEMYPKRSVALRRALVVCRDAWDGQSAGFEVRILRPVIMLIMINMHIDDRRLVKVLATYNPKRIPNAAEEGQAILGGNVYCAAARVIATWYNRKLTPRKRIIAPEVMGTRIKRRSEAEPKKEG